MSERENATHNGPKYLFWQREMSPGQLTRNNVILWATASCLSPPGCSTQALYWAGTRLGLRPIPTVWPKHARLLFRYLPAFVGIHAACADLDRWSQGGYVDFLVSLFSRSCVFFLFFVLPFFLWGEPRRYWHQDISTGWQLQGLDSITGNELCWEGTHTTLNSDMGDPGGLAWILRGWYVNKKVCFTSFHTMSL